jgi:hypothetical protein
LFASGYFAAPALKGLSCKALRIIQDGLLTTEDLTGETLENLRKRFGFDPRAVVRRAADFTL